MADPLLSARAFDRAVRARGATRTIALEHGLVVLHDDLPMLHHLNALLLDSPLAPGFDAAAVDQLAERHLGHLGHRHVVLDDTSAAERLDPQLQGQGWTRARSLYMVWRREPDQTPRPGLARELSEEQARSVQRAMIAEEAPAGPAGSAVTEALVAQLVAGQQAVRAGTRSRCFGAVQDAVVAASCTLFLEREAGGIGMIEEVGTLTAHRRRGLARAVVCAALDAARGQGCDPIIVPVDEDDWPQLLYAKLGFEPLGGQVAFTRSVGSAPG